MRERLKRSRVVHHERPDNERDELYSAESSQDEFEKLLDNSDDAWEYELSDVPGNPEIMVCGEPSVGKTSVLEAISQMRLPRGHVTYSRHATKFHLRNAESRSIKVSISPDSSRSEHEQKELREYCVTSAWDLEDTSTLHAAETIMFPSNENSNREPFLHDIMQVELSGPTLPRLTLIDVPGILNIHREQDQMVKNLERYISSDNLVVLAVVSTGNDPANSPVIEMAASVDPRGERTFGIVTKPDKIGRDSEFKDFWVKVARNEHQRLHLKKGWHVLLNRSQDEVRRNTDAATRDLRETIFFQGPSNPWNKVSAHSRGAENLRKRLAHVLGGRIRINPPVNGMSGAVDKRKDNFMGKARPPPGHVPKGDSFSVEDGNDPEKKRTCWAMALEAIVGLFRNLPPTQPREVNVC